MGSEMCIRDSAGHQWDQSDERDVEAGSDPEMAGQLTFDSDPVA